jgi:hypothetical protein
MPSRADIRTALARFVTGTSERRRSRPPRHGPWLPAPVAEAIAGALDPGKDAGRVDRRDALLALVDLRGALRPGCQSLRRQTLQQHLESPTGSALAVRGGRTGHAYCDGRSQSYSMD